MTLEEISAKWKIDSKIDLDQLDFESVKTFQLHSEYLDLLVPAKAKKFKLKLEYNNLLRLKKKYYLGQLTPQELKEHNLGSGYPFKRPLKSELDSLLEVDPDMMVITGKMDYVDLIVFKLESIMYAINQRTWGIKNAIEERKFKAGF